MKSMAWFFAAVPWLAACASDAPAAVTEGGFDASAGRMVVTLLGDDFALLDGVRMPLDAVVLRLRLQVRALGAEQLDRFVVKLVIGKDVPEAAAGRLMEQKKRLMEEAYVMGLRQLEYF